MARIALRPERMIIQVEETINNVVRKAMNRVATFLLSENYAAMFTAIFSPCESLTLMFGN